MGRLRGSFAYLTCAGTKPQERSMEDDSTTIPMDINKIHFQPCLQLQALRQGGITVAIQTWDGGVIPSTLHGWLSRLDGWKL